jgi:hypothetical protein
MDEYQKMKEEIIAEIERRKTETEDLRRSMECFIVQARLAQRIKACEDYIVIIESIF